MSFTDSRLWRQFWSFLTSQGEGRTCFFNMSTTQQNSMPAVPTFADRVRGVSTSKRTTCLNFKTKSDLKRHEIVELLKDTKFPTFKIIGIADMKGRSVDVTRVGNRYSKK